MGQENNADNVYIIDYGLSKKYVDEGSGLHIPMVKSDNFVGSKRYCSVNHDKGHSISRRDDCEGVIYMLSEFVNGDLPWSKSLPNDDNLYMRVQQLKNDAKATQIAKGFPSEFGLLYSYVR